MKIAYAFYDGPNYTAGPKINAMRILPEFVKQGHDVIALILYHEECPADAILRKRGVSVIKARRQRHIESQVAWFLEVLKQVDPDVFVPNIAVGGCYAARYLREAGRPTVAGHLSDDRLNWGLARRFCKAADPWSVSALFCMGSELGDQVRAWKPAQTKVVDIPHGVPTQIPPITQEGPLHLVFAGRFEQQQKRIMDLTKAVSDVLLQNTQMHATFIGDGTKRHDVDLLIRQQNLSDRFDLTGFVHPDLVQTKMQEANTFVLLSDYEGIPAAAMDAMACGLIPVCLAMPGGLSELVIHEQTGLIVSDRGSSFINALQRLQNDLKLRQRLAANARQHVLQNFSLQVTVDRWNKLFEDLISSAQPRRDIRIPRKIKLPPPMPELGNEDLRAPTIFERARSYAYQKKHGLKRSLRGFSPNA